MSEERVPGERERDDAHPNSVVVTLALAALSMYGPFTTDTVFPGFAQMGQQFGADDAALQQITSVYLLSFAIASLFHGPISDAVGRRPVMLASTLLYALASVGCALSPSLPVLLVFRVCQGVFAAGGLIISRTVVRDLYAGPAAQRLMSQVAMIFAVAPAVAPIIGGLLLGLGRWPVIFWFLVAYGLLTFACAALLPETHPAERRTPLHLGAQLSSLWQVTRHGSFQRIALASALGFSGQFVYIASAPIFVVTLLGRGERDFWLLFVPMISGMMLGAFAQGRLADRIPAPKLAGIGFIIAFAGAVLNVALMALGLHALPWPVVAVAVIAFGNQLFFPITQLAMLDLFPERRGAAASMGSFVSLLVYSALAAFVSPLVTASLLTLAVSSLGFVIVGWVLWSWHRRWLSRTHHEP